MAARINCDQRLTGQAGFLHGASGAFDLLTVVQDPATVEHGDAPMALGDQIARRLVAAGTVIDRHHLQAFLRQLRQHQQRIAGSANRPDMIEVAMVGRIDQNAIDLARLKQRERLLLVGDFAVAGGKHHAVAGRRQLTLDRARGQGQGRFMISVMIRPMVRVARFARERAM